MRYKIATICGSTRFKDLHLLVAEMLIKDEYMVFGCDCYGHVTDNPPTARQKIMFDDMHLKKIMISDLVYVVNPYGYIGDSAKKEMAFAMRLDIEVRLLFDVFENPIPPREGCKHFSDCHNCVNVTQCFKEYI